MRLESLRVLLCAIGLQRGHLEEAIAVAASQLCAVVVELAIVDVLLVLRVERENLGSLLLGRLLRLLLRLCFRVICHLLRIIYTFFT